MGSDSSWGSRICLALTIVLLTSGTAGWSSAQSSGGEGENPRPKFIDITNQTGLHLANPGEPITRAAYGPGISLVDCDADGDLDIFIGARYNHFGLGEEHENTGNGLLFRNDGNMSFTDITNESGLDLWDTTAMSSSWADYDGDGDMDAYVSFFGYTNHTNPDSGAPNRLYRNDGGCTFTDVTAEADVANPGHSASAIWNDYDHDGDLDLYSMNAGMVDEENLLVRGETNVLYQNQLMENGKATFTDVTKIAGVSGQTEVAEPGELALTEEVRADHSSPLSPSAQVSARLGEPSKGTGLSWAGLFFDFDGDGWDDLFVASDFGISPLYLNNQNGTFTLYTEQALLDVPGTGMGVDAADIDHDGDLDLCQTNLGPNYIWRSVEGAVFYEKHEVLNITGTEPTTWSCHWFDYDLDGDDDLFFSVGRIAFDTTINNNNFFENQEGGERFEDITEAVGLSTPAYKTMGMGVGDLDGDGDEDLVMGNSDALIQVFKNTARETTANEYLTVRLQGHETNENTFGVGSLVIMTTDDGRVQRKQVYAGHGFAGSGEPSVTFGLGQGRTVEALSVIWPCGQEVSYDMSAVGTEFTAHQPELSDREIWLWAGLLVLVIAAAGAGVAVWSMRQPQQPSSSSEEE